MSEFNVRLPQWGGYDCSKVSDPQPRNSCQVECLFPEQWERWRARLCIYMKWMTSLWDTRTALEIHQIKSYYCQIKQIIVIPSARQSYQRRNLWKEKPGRSMRVGLRLPVILKAVKDNDKRTITTSVTRVVSGQISP